MSLRTRVLTVALLAAVVAVASALTRGCASRAWRAHTGLPSTYLAGGA